MPGGHVLVKALILRDLQHSTNDCITHASVSQKSEQCIRYDLSDQQVQDALADHEGESKGQHNRTHLEQLMWNNSGYLFRWRQRLGL